MWHWNEHVSSQTKVSRQFSLFKAYPVTWHSLFDSVMWFSFCSSILYFILLQFLFASFYAWLLLSHNTIFQTWFVQATSYTELIINVNPKTSRESCIEQANPSLSASQWSSVLRWRSKFAIPGWSTQHLPRDLHQKIPNWMLFVWYFKLSNPCTGVNVDK